MCDTCNGDGLVYYRNGEPTAYKYLYRPPSPKVIDACPECGAKAEADYGARDMYKAETVPENVLAFRKAK